MSRWDDIRETVEKVEQYADEYLEEDYTVSIKIWTDDDFQIEAKSYFRVNGVKKVKQILYTNGQIQLITSYVEQPKFEVLENDEREILEEVKGENSG